MTTKTLANIVFSLQWKSPVAEHNDTFLINDIDFDNDVLAVGFKENLAKLNSGESYDQKFLAKDLLGEGYSSDKVTTFDAALFNNNFKNQHSPPMLYRFYPNAIAWQGLNTSDTDYTPFRLISKNQDEMRADQNHPLAKYYLTLTATLMDKFDKIDVKQPKKNIVKIITSRGPGMQAPFEFGDSVFFNEYPFKRKDNNISKINEIESDAYEKIQNLYSNILPKHSKILDVMSSEQSYLADDYQTGLLVGIGEDENALSKNKRLDTYSIQNLNNDLTLPFEENSFDNAICTMCIESITDPLFLMKEIARVINSKGHFIITFSDSYAKDQTISLWGQLHPFERIQLVLEYFRDSNLFTNLHTYSFRTIKRKSIYAVWGELR